MLLELHGHIEDIYIHHRRSLYFQSMLGIRSTDISILLYLCLRNQTYLPQKGKEGTRVSRPEPPGGAYDSALAALRLSL